MNNSSVELGRFAPIAFGLTSAAMLILFQAAVATTVFYLAIIAGYLYFAYRLKAPIGFSLWLLIATNFAVVGWLIYNTQSFQSQSFEAFIVGDSDSAVYDSAARSIAAQVPWTTQLKIWNLDYISLAEYEGGFQFKDTGFVWFLGALYTLVSAENGPAAAGLLNPVITSLSILVGVWGIRSSALNRKFFPGIAVGCCFGLFLSNMYVLQALGSCRKDALVVLLFTASIALFANKRIFFGAVLALATCSFRSGLSVGYVVGICYWIVTRRLRTVGILWLCCTLLLVLPLFLKFVNLYLPAMDSRISAETVEVMRSELRGSAVFVETWWLRGVYLLFSPFPSARLPSYVMSLDGILTAGAFLANLGLMVAVPFFFRSRGKYLHAADHTILCAIMLQYLAVLWNLQQATDLGMYGILEPRYKMAIWMLEVCVVVRLCAFPAGSQDETGARGRAEKRFDRQKGKPYAAVRSN